MLNLLYVIEINNNNAHLVKLLWMVDVIVVRDWLELMVIVKGNVYLTVILIEGNVYVFLDIKLFLQEHVYKSDNQDALIQTKSHLLMVNVDVSKDFIVIKIHVYHSAHNLINNGMEELVIVFQDLLDLDLINLVYLQ